MEQGREIEKNIWKMVTAILHKYCTIAAYNSSFHKEDAMNPNKKVLITVLSFVLAMVVIACSCSSIIPTATAKPPTNQETMPGLAGTWQDPETTDTFVIAWQNNQYVVTSVTWKTTSYQITSQSWDGSSLTWSYADTDLNPPRTTTYATTSLSGDKLNVTWSYSDGSGSGTEVLSHP
jgi:hypothetical protein